MNAHETPIIEQPGQASAVVEQAAPPAQVAPAAEPRQPVLPPTAQWSPGAAVVLSILPGIGHAYLGLYARGIGFFVAFFLVPKFFWIAGSGAMAVFSAIFVYVLCMIDASRQAQSLNSGYRAKPLDASARARLVGRKTLGLGIFLTVLGLVLLYAYQYGLDLSFLQTWWPGSLVIAGLFFIVWHFIEQKRRQAQDETPTM